MEPAGKTPADFARELATALSALETACAALRDRVSRSEERAAERDERLACAERSARDLRDALVALQEEKQKLLEGTAQHKVKMEALATSQLVRFCSLLLPCLCVLCVMRRPLADHALLYRLEHHSSDCLQTTYDLRFCEQSLTPQFRPAGEPRDLARGRGTQRSERSRRHIRRKTGSGCPTTRARRSQGSRRCSTWRPRRRGGDGLRAAC
jgi:hypothetical protein